MKVECENIKSYKRKIAQYDKQGHFIRTWDNYKDIFNETGFNKGAIYLCCHGKTKHAYGYRWSFV